MSATLDPAASVHRYAVTSLKLMRLMACTIKHMWRVPKNEPSRETLARHSQRWAQEMLRVAEIEVVVRGTPPPWGTLHASNHRSFMDIIVLMAQAPGTFLSKAEVADWPVIGPAAKLGGTVFVRRDIKDSRKAARETLRELLQEGASVNVFPEGTTAAPPGTILFRAGTFEVAAALGVQIAPVAIEYPRVEDAWVNNEPIATYYRRVFHRPMIVQVSFGPLMSGDDGERLRDEVHAWIQRELLRLHERLHSDDTT